MRTEQFWSPKASGIRWGMLFCFLVVAITPVHADFIVAPHPNFETAAEGSIFIFGQEGVSGTLTSEAGFDETFTIGEDGVVEIPVPQSHFLNEDDTVLGNAILAQADGSISGYFLNRLVFSTDMSFLFDLDALGTDHWVLAWNAGQIRDDEGEFVFEGVQMSVTAVEDGTTVTITPSADLVSGQPVGIPFDVQLDSGESIKYTAMSEQDLTGTWISATSPVAVFAGATCANVPTDVAFCDHLFSQIPSIDSYSSDFIVPETARTGTAGNLVRILAGENDTEVTVNGTLVAALDAGDFHQIDEANDLDIRTSRPVLVGQYLKGAQATGFGDPSFSIITGLDQLLGAYAFTAPIGDGSFEENYLNIAISSFALESLSLNGEPVDLSLFSEFGDTGFSTGIIPVDVGASFIEADEPFVASVSGFSQDDSYHTIIGATFAPGASPPHLPQLAELELSEQVLETPFPNDYFIHYAVENVDEIEAHGLVLSVEVAEPVALVGVYRQAPECAIEPRDGEYDFRCDLSDMDNWVCEVDGNLGSCHLDRLPVGAIASVIVHVVSDDFDPSLVEVTVEEPVFTVTASATPPDGGQILPSGELQARLGDQLEFELQPADGFILEAVEGTCGGNLDELSFVTSPIVSDCFISAVFGQLEFSTETVR